MRKIKDASPKKRKNKKHKITKVERTCISGLIFSLKSNDIWQEYLDKYGDEPDTYSHLSLLRIIQKANMAHVNNLYEILVEINPSFEKKIHQILDLESDKSFEALYDRIC